MRNVEPYPSNYLKKIRELVGRYNLSHTHNPGGAEFWRDGDFPIRNIQVYAMDDKEDYETLLKGLKTQNALTLAEVNHKRKKR